MKKTYIKSILLSASLAFVSVGCSDSFLEESPTRYVSVSDVEGTAKIYPEISDGTLRGVYEMMFKTGTGGTTDHADFGQKGYDIYSDLLSGDIALTKNSYNRYNNFAQLISTVDFTFDAPNYMAWRYYYRIINASNLVIQSLGGNDAVITDVNRRAMGQAKALRAYAYFYLTQFYIPEYTPTSTVLPIYTEPNSPAKAQSTTDEVYKLMIKDLEEAVTLLDGFNRTNDYAINQNVARGLLAYVYASMGDSANNMKAKALAEAVIMSGDFPLTTKEALTGGFNNINTSPSWMWGVDLTLDNGLDLISWWGQMDVFTYSYQFAGDKKAIDVNLYNSIKANDARKGQFLNNPASSNHLAPLNKFYAPERIEGRQRNIETDYIYMRIEEMYLLSAEMSAKEGADADAINRLKEVLAIRFDNAADYAYVDALTGKALQDEIYLQTRIEFVAEGKSYLALKRNKGTVTRGANHLYLVNEPILYNDNRLDLEIPQSEIQNNPFIN
ncbi:MULTISPECIES: RagB/SusD family nutrient uptake outer membrane protein [unclassified Tenacibaculum]|uniref:RagB/SusD family nutrient uptake outer membrane protein n=1 Tax=unclassified Tenacibaculum TaxID=2635139 RepID=UPI001F1ADB80|nr:MULTISPECIES: RagB/SusD family nutrient uptake outer membrane protein [unclassified Tenacibaculum]MCF2875377.1 RagB/SusD family nutrient uptake outer membrane protein [Tenacibaculum sp. Cn5-1]MCF2935453.1 RagB/SusD family nutrient uptake outer membrane protein [Tenacibaculum sp. Cn5-34]MCG7512013.1 RagB/SusD family nutrient uptake outer membrane protein [Tenacibaculum sp. Cn5-46]